MITLKRPEVKFEKRHEFQNIEERNKVAAKKTQQSLENFKKAAISSVYEASNFRPHTKLLLKKSK